MYSSLIQPTVMIRKSTLEQMFLSYLDYACTEDYKLWTDLALAGARLANILKYYYVIDLPQTKSRINIGIRCLILVIKLD
ncbi:hypothetical protein ACNQGP_01555 [Flavobacterium sp. GT2N3]|uniref:hypothetical protein n=1 Tax=unclassified Flavobacterium TaxID=196869 RepID=UPI003AAC30DC